MILRSWPVQARLTLFCGGFVLLAGGLLLSLAYAVRPIWAGVALAVLTAGGAWLSWLVAGGTLRPILRMTATARRVGDGNPQDITELADSLDRAFDAQRRFVADAAWEMKRPLAQNRSLLETAMSRPDAPSQVTQLGATLLEVTGRHEKLIDELLTLTRLEQAVTEPIPVELADIAYRVSDELEPEARRAGIELRVSAGPARTPGDPILLERLAENLLRNAVRYNTADGWVRVATGTDENTVRLTVVNTGPVVDTYEVPALFEPFHRADSAPGTGLGLSIVQRVARAHGGQVSAAPRDGGGLVVEVTLPRLVY